MSVFTEQSTTTESEKDYIADIVAEKGAQWSDPQVVAKGYATSQEYIAKLELDLRASQEAASKQDYMKELLEKMNGANSTPSVREPAPTNTGSEPKGDDQPSIGAEQIKELVKEALTQDELNRTATQNVAEADKKLTEMFGTEAQSVVDKRGAELGMSKERMKQIAQESPTAFLALMGTPPAKETNTTTTSTVNTSNFNANPSERNFRFYMDLKKSNPKQFRSAAIQDQMLEDRNKLGDKFY